MSRLLATFLVLTTACGVELVVPTGAQITCNTDAQCPTRHRCRDGRCAAEGNSPPSVTVRTIKRTVELVEISVTLFDEEGDVVSLEASVSEAGAAPRQVASFEALPTSDEGHDEILKWDAASFFNGTSYRDELVLHLTPRDANSAGTTVSSERFAFGNGTPELLAASIELSEDDSVTGLAILRIEVRDTSSDPLRLSTFEVSDSADFSGIVDSVSIDSSSFPAGGISNLLSDPEVVTEHAMVWDSAARFDVDRAPVFARVTVEDDFEQSTPLVIGPFAIDNDTNPPFLEILEEPVGSVSERVLVKIRITDGDNDECLVVPQWSTDGHTWTMAASETDTVGISPGDYDFYWESTQLGFTEVVDNVRLRFSISDVNDEGTGDTTELFTVDNTGITNNAAPSTSIGKVAPGAGGRFVTTVRVPLLVSDPEAHPVDLAVYYSLDPDALLVDWHLATPLGERDSSLCEPGDDVLCTALDLNGVRSSVAGVPYTFEWDAISDADLLGTKDLTLQPDVLVDSTPTNVVGPLHDVWVRVIPTDVPPSPLSPKTGNPNTSVPFPLGNLPPTPAFALETVALAGPPAIEVSGEVGVQLTLTDELSDNATVELEYSLTAGATWFPITLALGRLTNLATTPGGLSHVVVWNTVADLGATIKSDVWLRMRASDVPDGVSTHTSAWVELPGLSVRNQTPPRVEVLYVKGDSGMFTGRIPIVFRLIDAERDPATVYFEYTTDSGTTWVPASEYPSVVSATRDLTTAPADDTSGANVHGFVWDSATDLFAPSTDLQLRVTAADAESAGSSTIALPTTVAGPPAVPPNDQAFVVSPPYVIAGRPGLGTVIDFDGDDVLDIVVPSITGNTITILFGNAPADGTFTLSSSFPMETQSSDGTAAQAVVVEDFDEDGVLDFAVVGTLGHLRVRLGTGDGSWDGGFGPAATYDIGGGGYGLDAGDINGDGVLDLVLARRASNDSHVIRLLGQGTDGNETGTFGEMAIYDPEGFSVDMALVDLDGDGRLDVVTSNTGSEGLQVGWGQPGDDAGTFPVFDSFAGGSGDRLAIADMNGDNLTDVLLASGVSPPGVTVFLRDPAQSRGFVVHGPFSRVGEIGSLAVADFNLDGDLDVASTSPASGDLLLWLGDGTGDLRPTLPQLEGELPHAEFIATGDFDGDQLTDLAVFESNSGENSVWIVASDGVVELSAVTFGPTRTNPSCRFLKKPIIFDLNADGRVDIVSVCLNSAIQPTYGRGFGPVANGAFELGVGLTGTSGTTDFDLGDMNNDGVLDIVSAGSWTFLTLGYGDCGQAAMGTSTRTQVEAGVTVSQIVVADLTGDAHLDVAGTRASANEALVWAGDGAGGFTRVATLALSDAPRPYRPRVGDTNADADRDLVFAVNSGVAVATSNGAGGFNTPVVYQHGGGLTTGLSLCDFRGGGTLDILVSDDTGDVFLFSGLETAGVPNGTFTDGAGTLVLATTGVANNPECADLDGDGHTDLLVAHTEDESFLVALGDGTGSFGMPKAYAGLPEVEEVLTADLNRDGGLDVALLSRAEPGALGTSTVRLESLRYPWRRTLGQWEPGFPGGSALGSDVLLNESTNFGPGIGFVARVHTIGARRYHGGADQGAFRGTRTYATFTDGARTHLDLGGRLVPVTDAWVFSGDISLVRGVDPGAALGEDTGSRLRVRHNFGPAAGGEQEGLSLTGAFANQRGLFVDLPITVDPASINPDKVIVYGLFSKFVRADEIPADTIAGEEGAHDYLPRLPIPNEGGYRDVVRERFTWKTIPEATESSPGVYDLSADVDKRWVLDLDASPPRVRVLTDALGVFQAAQGP